MLTCVAEPLKVDNASCVNHAEDLTSGRKKLISIIAKNTGLDYGLKRAIPFDSSACFQGIADPNCNGLKTIGLIFHLKMRPIFRGINTLFTMELIFIRMDVLSIS